MATITELVGQKVLRLLRLPLPNRELHNRTLYVTDWFVNWMLGDLPNIRATFWEDDLPAKQQVRLLLEAYSSGKSLAHPKQFHILKPWEHGVWELKTGDTRIFGWFLAFDTFVAARGAATFDVKDMAQYEHHIARVIGCRVRMELDEPEFVSGEDPRFVLSN